MGASQLRLSWCIYHSALLTEAISCREPSGHVGLGATGQRDEARDCGMLRRFRAAPRKQRARRAQAFFTTLRQAGPSQKSLPSVSSTSGYSGRDLPGAASAASAVSGASSVARRQLTHAFEPIGTRRLSPKPKLALSEVMSPLSEVSVEMMMRGPSIVCFPVCSTLCMFYFLL